MQISPESHQNKNKYLKQKFYFNNKIIPDIIKIK